MKLRGDRIDLLRRRLGLTMERLADQVGVSRVYMQDLKAGKKKNASHDVVTRLAAALGCSTTYLLEEEEIARIPVVGQLLAKPLKAAGLGERSRGSKNLEHVSAFPPELIGRLQAVRVGDDSLEPIFRKGDILYYELPSEDGSVSGDALGERCIIRTIEGISAGILHLPNGMGMYGLQPLSGGEVRYADIKWASKILLVGFAG